MHIFSFNFNFQQFDFIDKKICSVLLVNKFLIFKFLQHSYYTTNIYGNILYYVIL